MATLHMDVDACESAQRNIQSKCDQLRELLNRTSNRVNSSVGQIWTSDSANQFVNLFEGREQEIKERLRELDQQLDRVHEEIEHWKRMAERLGN